MTDIIHISPSYKPAYIYGGPTLSVSRLAEVLNEAMHSVEVITTSANGAQELDVLLGKPQIIDGVKCTYFLRWTKDHSHFSPALLWVFYWNIRKSKTIHIHSWWNLVTIPAVFLCRLRGIRPILSPRGMLSPYTFKSPVKRLFHHFIGRWLLKGTVLHATSTQEAQEALTLIPNWPHFILPNIIELPALGAYSPTTAKKDHFSMIFLSRIHPKKGLETLFEALSSVDFSWRLQIVGEGEESYVSLLKNLAREYSITDRIDWLGWRNGSEKFQLLADADLFVLPSQNENFANVVLESLAVGTPVILSDQVGLSEYVIKQNFGWVYSGGSTELAQQLHLAWNDQNRCEAIRSEAPLQVHTDFGADTLAQQYLAAYQEYTQ